MPDVDAEKKAELAETLAETALRKSREARDAAERLAAARAASSRELRATPPAEITEDEAENEETEKPAAIPSIRGRRILTMTRVRARVWVRGAVLDEALALQADADDGKEVGKCSDVINSGWTMATIVKSISTTEGEGADEAAGGGMGVTLLVEDEDSVHNGKTVHIPPSLMVRAFSASVPVSGSASTSIPAPAPAPDSSSTLGRPPSPVSKGKREELRSKADKIKSELDEARKRAAQDAGVTAAAAAAERDAQNQEMEALRKEAETAISNLNKTKEESVREVERIQKESNDHRRVLEESMQVAEEEKQRIAVQLEEMTGELRQSEDMLSRLEEENERLKQDLEASYAAEANASAKEDDERSMLEQKEKEYLDLLSIKDDEIEKLKNEVQTVNDEADKYAAKAQQANSADKETAALQKQVMELTETVEHLMEDEAKANKVKGSSRKLKSFRVSRK